jgi:urease accessory protein
MRRLVTVAKAGTWPGEAAIGSVTLAYEDRHRRRLRFSTDEGEPVLLDLTKPQPLDEGDGLALEDDGGWLVVRAAAEEVLEITGRDQLHLIRLAWHLGNRRLPTQILAEGRLRIRYDHVIEDLLGKLGAICARVQAPFQPQSGGHQPR